MRPALGTLHLWKSLLLLGTIVVLVVAAGPNGTNIWTCHENTLGPNTHTNCVARACYSEITTMLLLRIQNGEADSINQMRCRDRHQNVHIDAYTS